MRRCQRLRAPRYSSSKKVIVIDPGHGGIDSGTSGVNGLLEQDLVLAEGLRVAKALRHNPNYTVHMTRDSDVFIPLRERVNIARTHHADLFISLHADSNPDPSVTGFSVYTLSESGSDREAAALARKENQSDIIAGVDLGGENSAVAPILIDLAQRDTMNKSSRFANLAVSTLSRATDILPRQPHRSAAFVVLKAPGCSLGPDRTRLSVQFERCGADEHGPLARRGRRCHCRRGGTALCRGNGCGAAAHDG